MVIYDMFTNNRFYPVSSISEQCSQISAPGGLPQFHSFQSCFGSLYLGYTEADNFVGLWQERNLECEVTGVIPLTNRSPTHLTLRFNFCLVCLGRRCAMDATPAQRAEYFKRKHTNSTRIVSCTNINRRAGTSHCGLCGYLQKNA
jgi:hypothetical protein